MHGRAFSACRALSAAAALSLAAALPCRAIGPHEVALVVNEESLDSILLAETWARLRSVPAPNVVRVSVPAGEDGAFPEAITKERFEELVWGPANAALERSGAAPRVLAWVYSCDFPVRVAESEETLAKSSTNDLSITGATFLRAAWPEPETIAEGTFASPLYAGPDEPSGEAGHARSFDRVRNDLLDRMPLPAAMLAYTGPRGIPVEEAMDALARSAAADGTAPTGTVWATLRPGVRSESREWQIAPAFADVSARDGFDAVVSTNDPAAGDGPIVGYMTGARAVVPVPELAAGAYADHFTSWAAAYEIGAQMKATEWLRAGAASTSGQVCEPFANWAKFPTAWIFPRLLDGATAIEALYASVRCPLQLFPLGDPLSAPWASAPSPATLVRIADGTARPVGDASGIVPLVADCDVPDGMVVKFSWFVDGKPAGSGPEFPWNSANLPDGPHEVRLVARVQNTLERQQAFSVTTFNVSNADR
ncbi:MAG: TIGR03790 family protein [Kiritimatiellae bacterium]|nr:TIGR03790 family protein [Kiritimatiellia bacterium]